MYIAFLLRCYETQQTVTYKMNRIGIPSNMLPQRFPEQVRPVRHVDDEADEVFLPASPVDAVMGEGEDEDEPDVFVSGFELSRSKEDACPLCQLVQYDDDPELKDQIASIEQTLIREFRQKPSTAVEDALSEFRKLSEFIDSDMEPLSEALVYKHIERHIAEPTDLVVEQSIYRLAHRTIAENQLFKQLPDGRVVVDPKGLKLLSMCTRSWAIVQNAASRQSSLM